MTFHIQYAPWCWYIYLQNWVILFGQMLVNIPYMEHIGILGIMTPTEELIFSEGLKPPTSIGKTILLMVIREISGNIVIYSYGREI